MANVNKTPKQQERMMRYDLTYFEWSVIQPLSPNKLRGVNPATDRWPAAAASTDMTPHVIAAVG